MLRTTGTEYYNICSIRMRRGLEGTEYRNIKGLNIWVLYTFKTNSYIFYKYYGALHLMLLSVKTQTTTSKNHHTSQFQKTINPFKK